MSIEAWHGSVGGYTNHACRCDACRKAKAEYMRGYRARRFPPGTKCITGCGRAAALEAGNGRCRRCHKNRLEAGDA